jgi:signal transduction histidine kinase
VFPSDQAEQQLELVCRTLEFGTSHSADICLKAEDVDMCFNVRYNPIRSQENDNSSFVLGIARDITASKNLEQQIIIAEKIASLKTLAAGVAHEINNPLGIILGFCDLMLERTEPGTLEYFDLKTIERHGILCKDIIARLACFAGAAEICEENCNINAAVNAAVNAVKQKPDGRGIRFVLHTADGLPSVKGDSKELQEALLNIIGNAAQAMNGYGVVTVSTRLDAEKGQVRIVISDMGNGIKKRHIKRVFDPFFTTKEVGEGFGLGLSISYAIISRHGGSVECRSCSQEEGFYRSGTTFTISLPVSPEIASGLVP